MCRRSRKQVLVAGKELDYQMNMMACEFSSNRTLLLGLIAPFRGLLGAFLLWLGVAGRAAGRLRNGLPHGPLRQSVGGRQLRLTD
jgi:hypothetical protein